MAKADRTGILTKQTGCERANIQTRLTGCEGMEMKPESVSSDEIRRIDPGSFSSCRTRLPLSAGPFATGLLSQYAGLVGFGNLGLLQSR